MAKSTLEPGLVEIRTTFPSQATAAASAELLVAGRLAACVQVEGPISSTYRWQGAVETAVEWRCTCKTTAARRDDCVAAILSGHAYETPQVTVVSLEASPAYAAWVRESVGDT